MSDWDYSDLAAHYDQRPDYAADLLVELGSILRQRKLTAGVDVGAGTGYLTTWLERHCKRVLAMEPCKEMMARGRVKTQHAQWISGSGQQLPVLNDSIDVITFGSSLNVIGTSNALSEAARVLRPNGLLLCLWNHRDLDDPLQREIERAITRLVPNFRYGERRKDHSGSIDGHDQFKLLSSHRVGFVTELPTRQFKAAWRSHATLKRQAGSAWDQILATIGAHLGDVDTVRVPYHTVAWLGARL